MKNCVVDAITLYSTKDKNFPSIVHLCLENSLFEKAFLYLHIMNTDVQCSCGCENDSQIATYEKTQCQNDVMWCG